VKLAGFVYALHAFQKKSRKGAKTAQSDIEKIRSRLKIAEEDHAERVAASEKQKEESDEEDE
jgi:phage-related protein